jgi:murein DD-endopeptidase MepM/ murein hydrolase activator NlpD
VSLFDSPACVIPVPMLDRRASISDGFHPKGDMRFRNGVGHRGTDWMYRRRLPALTKAAMGHPWGSRWYFMVPNTPALAILPGKVYRAGKLSTGWRVILDHGSEHGSGYYHLSSLAPGIDFGINVEAGQPLGVIGGSPAPGTFGLCHLHLDVAIKGRFVDPAPFARKWRHLSLAEAGRVGWHDEWPPADT